MGESLRQFLHARFLVRGESRSRSSAGSSTTSPTKKKNIEAGVDLSFLDEPHACPRCDPGVRPGEERGGVLRIDHRPFDGCPYELIPPETWDMIFAFNDWEHGHTPVTAGRAPWLPTIFADAVHEVGATVRRANDARRLRQAARARQANRERAFS